MYTDHLTLLPDISNATESEKKTVKIFFGKMTENFQQKRIYN